MSGAEDRVRSGDPPMGGQAGPRNHRWGRVGAVTVGLVVLVPLLSFGLGRDPRLIQTVLDGRRAPDFTLRTLDGTGTVRLSDFRGQVVVVNFWASWCAECRLEAPALEAAWERYRDGGVVVFGIAYQDTPSAALAFAAEAGKTYPLLSDPGSETALAYGVYGIPETFFIGPDGRIASKRIGAVSYDLLTQWISRLVQEDRQ